MPLNVKAKEWLPPGGLSKQLQSTSNVGGDSTTMMGISDASKVPDGSNLIKNDSELFGICHRSPVNAVSPGEESQQAGYSSTPVDEEEELLFDVNINERHAITSQGTSSPRSTPKTSLVGPSPLPSPLLSPVASPILEYGSLMKQTERLSIALEAAKKGELKAFNDMKNSTVDLEQDEAEPTVTTHVETETSAAISGGQKQKLGPEDF